MRADRSIWAWLALGAILSGCGGVASYIEVSITSSAALTLDTLEVAVKVGGKVSDFRITPPEALSLPPPQNFSIELEPERRGRASVDVRGLLGDREVARSMAVVVIAPGGTVPLSLVLSPTGGGGASSP